MRKLATAALGFSIAVFASQYFVAPQWLITVSIVSFCCSFSGLFFYGNIRKRMLIMFISLSFGFLWSLLFTSVFVKPFVSLHEQSVTFEAVVIDYPVKREPRGYRVDVSAKLQDNGIKSTNTRLYYYNETELKPGDVISVTANLYRTDVNSDSERYDTLTARSIFLSGSVTGDIENNGSINSLRYFPKQIAMHITNTIGEIYPDDVSGFLKALLTGNRNDLYKDKALSSALSASGIIHIVAVSGMHISFLMGFLGLIIKNKKLFSFYAIPVLLFFMAMTGFTPAVTRAGIMQIFLICAPLFKRERDSITSLSAAMLIILILNPYSCADVGLHLSFASTLGIILFTSRINNAVSEFVRSKHIKKRRVLKAVINYVSSNLATTIGALVFSLPVMAVHFGYVSLISPLTNFFTIGVVSLVFPLAIIATLLALINPLISNIIVYPVGCAVRYIITIARVFATVPYSVVYTSSMHIMFWLLYVYLIFIIMPLLKARLRQYLYPVCIAIILLFAVIFISTLFPGEASGTAAVTVLDVGQGLSVVVQTEGGTVVIDCGSISTNKAGEITHEYLMNIECSSIDILAVTHFHDDHINGIEYLLSRMSVSTLVIPDPEGSFTATDIIELARRKGTDIIYVSQTMVFTTADSNVIIYPPLGSGDENERGLSVLIMGELNTLITGDMNATIERALLRYADLPKLDVLIAGHHGSRESTSQELLDALTPAVAIISVGRNSFGHPHIDTLRRLDSAAVRVYRTDEMGHITIRD